MEKPKHDKQPSEYTQEFLDYIDRCRKEYDEALKLVEEADDFRCDCLHLLEMTKEAKGPKGRNHLATVIYKESLRRREAKNKCIKLKPVIEFVNGANNRDILKRAKGLVNTQKSKEAYANSEEKVYKPRTEFWRKWMEEE